jgi:FtsZ-binding cell division protein ZapB
MNITNTMCRLSELSQWEIDSLVDNMPISDYFNFYSEELFIGFWSDGRVGTWPADAAQKIVTYTEMMQLLGKTMQFTKSDLIKLAQSNTVFVKYRDESYRVLINGVFNGVGWATMDDFSDDLKSKAIGRMDVVAVYTSNPFTPLVYQLEGQHLKRIWERTEQTEAQKEMEVLQTQAKALQEQAQAIQEQITKLQGHYNEQVTKRN